MTRTGVQPARPAELTAEGLAALGPGNACDREPIHLSGAIQPHGVLLVVDPTSYVVTAASVNFPLLTTHAHTPLGAALADVIGPDLAEAVRAAHTTGNPHDGLPVPVQLPTTDERGGATYHMMAHRRGRALVLELEVAGTQDHASPARFYQRQRDAVNALHEVDGVQAICARTVQLVRELTGYDRVMIYRFEPDAHGHVVAEACETGLTPYLGLHYPATDIPRQARALFLQNWIRVIADVDAEPVPIVALADGTPVHELDLSMCVLRSVSPMHLQYLRNMGVGASLTVSLIVDNQLWGLIACHHGTPKRAGHMQRLACEALGQLVSVRLRAAQTTENDQYSADLSHLRAQLIASIANNENLAAGAADAPDALLDMVAADGAVVEIEGDQRSPWAWCPRGEGAGRARRSVSPRRLGASGRTTGDRRPRRRSAAKRLADAGDRRRAAVGRLRRGAMFLRLVGRPDGFILWLPERTRDRPLGRAAGLKADAPIRPLGPRASFGSGWTRYGAAAPRGGRRRSLPPKSSPDVMPEVILHRAQSQLGPVGAPRPADRAAQPDADERPAGRAAREHPLPPPKRRLGRRPRRRACSSTSTGSRRQRHRGHLVGISNCSSSSARRLVEVVRPQDTVASYSAGRVVVVVPARSEMRWHRPIGERIVEEFRRSSCAATR